MTDRYTPPRGTSRASGDGWSQGSDSDGWGPATATYSGASRAAGRRSTPDLPNASAPGRGSGRAGDPPASPRSGAPARASGRRGTPTDAEWNPGGPASREQQRANRMMERQLREMRTINQTPERGLRWWAALLVLIAIAVIGGLIDTIGTTAARGGFNIGIIVASIVAILIVKRSHMFPIVIAPPIVYSLAAMFQLYLRSSGLHDKKVVLDAAANYLVYGFPAIAAATAAVLIIAGARMILRK